eukprot:gene58208-77673_t
MAPPATRGEALALAEAIGHHLKMTDTAAFALANLFAPPQDLPWKPLDLGRPIGTATAAAIPMGILESVRFLIEHLARRGRPVSEGTLISTGAVTGVHSVEIGARRNSTIPEPGAPLAVEPIQIQPPSGKYRWVVVWLLFAAMVINYVDRQALGVLKPTLMDEFGWTETNYADIVFWFQAAYAVSYLLWGRLVDKIGARWGFGIAFIIWQI